MIVVYILLVFIVILMGIIILRTLRFTLPPLNKTHGVRKIDDPEKLAEKLSKVIQVDSVSYMDKSKIDYEKFIEIHHILEKEFPRIHKQLEKSVINQYSLLYRWKGTKPQGKPSLYMAHMDVVPISQDSIDQWKYPPFDGAIEEAYVWGRGSLDTKNTLICAMEGVERLLEQGFTPKDDIYLAFGHDEEIQGMDGAAKIVEYLMDQGIRIDTILDEGGVITLDSIEGLDQPLALVGIGEKGYMDVKVTLKGQSGHASMPPKHTAVGDLSRFVDRMENKQMPTKLLKPVEDFLMIVGPQMGRLNKTVLANMWLLKPVFMKVFQASHTGNALLRTTTAATMLKGSNASNVLPDRASVTFNFRIALGDTSKKVIDHIYSNAKGLDLNLKIGESKEPSKISPTDVAGYKKIKESIEEVFGQVLVAPYVVMAATDSVKYEPICNNIYRFAPVQVSAAELATIHSDNERISLDNLGKCVSFYMDLMSKC